MKLTDGYISNRDGVPRSGKTVDSLLTKIEDLRVATPTINGIMSAQDKGKLDTLEDDVELTNEEIDRLCF